MENKNCRVLRKCASLGLGDLKVTDIRASNSGSIKHLIELNDNQAKKTPKDATEILSRGKSKDKYSWFESKGGEVCRAILSRDAFLISGKNTEKGAFEPKPRILTEKQEKVF